MVAHVFQFVEQPLKVPARRKPRKETRVTPENLRAFIGAPRGKVWKEILAAAGVELRWARKGMRKKLTRDECRKVLEAAFGRLGAWRIRQR